MSNDLRDYIDQIRTAPDPTIAGRVLLELLDTHRLPTLAKARAAALEAQGDAIAPYPGGKPDPYGDAFRAFVGVLIREHSDLLPKMTRETAPGHRVSSAPPGNKNAAKQCGQNVHSASTAPPAGWQMNFAAGVLDSVAAGSTGSDNDGGEYMPADWLEQEHGIRPQRLSEAARDGKVRTSEAPSHMRTATGAGPRVLYRVDDALKHCAPKRTKCRTTDALRALGDAVRAAKHRP